jgi:serine/threonine protein phosphatase PrpC
LRTSLLRGRAHLAIGAVDAVAEGSAAIAISRGGAPKTYFHVDPNEDAALLAVGERGALVAVADGHHGALAAEVALEVVAAGPAQRLLEAGAACAERWADAAAALLEEANRAVRAEGDAAYARLEGAGVRTGRRAALPRPGATLAVALVVPAEGAMLFVALGDSHVYRASEREVVDLAARAAREPAFLGHADAGAASLAARAAIGAAPLAGARAVVLATDGLSEPGIGVDDPEAAVRDALEEAARAAPALRPLVTARVLVERACAAQRRYRAGDNVATAVLWCDEAIKKGVWHRS